MAHVLLPCDLPSWPDVQSLLARAKSCSDGRELARLMTTIFDTCRVSLDPDDLQQPEEGHPGFLELGRFLQEGLSEAERNHVLRETLPELATRAADLKLLKPPEGFLYSLRKQGGNFQLERGFVASLLANAFFSTFPKRNSKTHPTLQDFRMADFFLYLNKRSHQKKLKAFWRYFENLGHSASGYVTFTRKVVQGPSLPGWLCSDRPLVPLLVRPEGSVHEAEATAFRACFCPPLIGGDVLKASTSRESKLFFCFPELLVILSFVESLEDDEALIAQGQQGGPVGFCFMDSENFSEDATRQFEDRFLLRELNKALAAFLHDATFDPSPTLEEVQGTWNSLPNLAPAEAVPQSRRSSGSGAARRTMFAKKHPSPGRDKNKSGSQASSKISMRTASESSVQPPKDDDYYTADDDSDEGSRPADSFHRTEETSLSRSDSLGFVLGEEVESDESSLPRHERLEDFRKRIRKRTRRRLSRRSSRSSYLSNSSGSSDMEDISEDPEEPSFHRLVIRPASSEPSLVSALVSESLCPSLCAAAETALLSMKGPKKLMVRSSNGHLKAYSYDGVRPNLPVPFRASFRRRPHQDSPVPTSLWSHQESLASLLVSPVETEKKCPVAVSGTECCGEAGDHQLKVTILWLAASMAELHSLVLYTTQLHEVCNVYGRVVAREWTVGDLSCEVLRFCRNTLSPSRRKTRLFAQLTGHTTQQQSQHHSLDLD